jgi:chromosome segregation ATPase
MESLLVDKQALIDSKEEDLGLLRERLQKIETGLATPEDLEKNDSESSTQQDDSEEEIKQLKEQIQELEKERDHALVKLKDAMEEERALLIRNQEEAEENLRDNMEKLREKLESEKQELGKRIVEKEKEIYRIKREMDELRDSIQVKA